MKTTSKLHLLRMSMILTVGISTFELSAQLDPALVSQLQLTLDSELDDQGTIGISAAIYIPGQGMWTGTSGLSSITSSTNPVTTDMLFDYGSITKNYTAAIILQLEEEGALSIDDPMYMYLPGLNNSYIDTMATLKQMMNMTSGTYDYTSNPNFFPDLMGDPAKCWVQDSLISTYVDSVNYFSPGTDWRYCNTGFNLLGEIILNVTGAPDLETVYSNRLFNPNNLTTQQFGVCDLSTAGFAHPWGDIGLGLIDMSWFSRNALLTGAYSAGALTGNAEDVALWNKALFLDKVVLSQASLDSMLSFIPLSTSPSQWWDGYGLGTMRMESCNEEWYGYGGDILGYTSMGMFNPQDSVIIAFVMNQDNVMVGRIEMMTALCTTINNYFQFLDIEENEEISTTTQAYPNPFNESLTIKYNLHQSENVRVSVFDLLGNEVALLSNEKQEVGIHELMWDGDGIKGNVPAGQYFVWIQGESSNVRIRVVKTSM